jgi:hypothetical protein
MKYIEDPLFKSKKLVLYKNVLNLYSALVKIEDFENQRPLNSIPYLTGKISKKINLLISEDLIEDLEIYMQQRISKKIIRSWVNNKIIPFPLLRILSLRDKNPIRRLSEDIKLVKTITTNSKANYLRLPLLFNELFSDNLLYFYGYLLGDGCISKERVIKFCDGHQNLAKQEYSIRFLESIQRYIKGKFDLPSKLTKGGNYYELILTSKYLCRFFKFFYDFKKDKKIITKPKIIKNNKEKSCVFYRGFFDADAGIKVKDKFLTLKIIDETFLIGCKKDFIECGIPTSRISYDNRNLPFLKIYAQNLYSYAKNIGFNHPRKKEILINHLKKGCLIRKLNSVKKNNLINNKFYDLSKIPDLRIKGVSFIVKQNRRKLGTQQHVANLLLTFRENIKRWENNTDSIPFHYYLKLMKLRNFTKEKVIIDSSKRKVLFGKGNLKQLVRLPSTFKKAHLKIFKYLNPTKDRTIVKSYGLDNREINRKELLKEIEVFFGIKTVRDSSSDIISSTLISSFLSTFFNYENSWNPLSEKEIATLEKKWKVL